MLRGTLVIFLVFFSTSVFAKNVCYNLFRIQPQKVVLISAQSNNFNEIPFLKENLSHVRNVQELKDGLYEIASTGNQIIDSLVDIILFFDQAQSKEDQENLTEKMRELTGVLQMNLGIMDGELISVVKIRASERVKEEAVLLEKSIIQQPIGFLRPHQGPWKEDATDREMTFGFTDTDKPSEKMEESQKIPIGFYRFNRIIENEEPKPQNMGFGRYGDRIEQDVDSSHQAGYQRYPLEDLNQSTFTFQLFLNIKTGYFDVEWWF